MTGEHSEGPNGRHAGKTMPVLAPGFMLPALKDAGPEGPDSELLGLCARFKHRMSERMQVVTDDMDADGRPAEAGDGPIRELWWADLWRIRKIKSQTVPGALAKYWIARSLYEWSSGLDLTLGEFLFEAGNEIESRLKEALQAGMQELQGSALNRNQQPLLRRLFSAF